MPNFSNIVNILPFVWVFVGGGLGSVTRYSLSRALPTMIGGFPLATLAANVVACITVGLLAGGLLRSSVPEAARWWGITGFCGGLSTFSTFSNETLLLLQSGRYMLAIIYGVISFAACIGSVAMGYTLLGILR